MKGKVRPNGSATSPDGFSPRRRLHSSRASRTRRRVSWGRKRRR